jgi:exodeoxyribonuclease VII small subunit
MDGSRLRREEPNGKKLTPMSERIMPDEQGETGVQEMSLEARLKRLEAIVGNLEAQELELDGALALFEEGVGHVKEAEKVLAAAELRVEELLGEGEETSTRALGEGDR